MMPLAIVGAGRELLYAVLLAVLAAVAMPPAEDHGQTALAAACCPGCQCVELNSTSPGWFFYYSSTGTGAPVFRALESDLLVSESARVDIDLDGSKPGDYSLGSGLITVDFYGRIWSSEMPTTGLWQVTHDVAAHQLPAIDLETR